MIKNSIKNYLEQEKVNIINDCISLISIPSVSSNKQELKKALDFVIKNATNMGFNAYSVLDDSVGIVEFGEGNETIGILAHIDVVPAGDEALWEYPPFSGVYKDGWICGRGAIDDKGPVISAIYAMKALKNLNVPINKKIQLIIGTQEEVIWTDIDEYKKHYPLPDFGFTPDGEFPITTKEKGCVDMELIFEKCPSAADFEVIAISGGEAINAVPDYCEIILKGATNLLEQKRNSFLLNNPQYSERLKIDEVSTGIKVYSLGFSAHSSVPEKGINAISILAAFLNTIALNDLGLANLLSFVVNSKQNFLEAYVDEKEYKTTAVASIINTSDNNYTLSVNLRTSLTTVLDDLTLAFEDMRNKYNFKYDILSYLAPISVNEKSEFLQLMAKSYDEISGFKNEFKIAFGTTYAKAMPNTVSFGPIFPGEHDSCHEVNERISSETLIKATNIYAYFLYLAGTSTQQLF